MTLMTSPRTRRVPEDAHARPVPPAALDTPPPTPPADDSPMAKNDAPPAERPSVSFTISAVLDGFPVTVQFTGRAEQLQATITRLQQLGATPPSRAIEWSYTPDGLPICPKHGAPMRKREKQGDAWHSHVVTGPNGDDLYCRGYHGKDSPGYEC